jgi:hypothetical protein
MATRLNRCGEPVAASESCYTETARRRRPTHASHHHACQPVCSLRLPAHHGAADAGDWKVGKDRVERIWQRGDEGTADAAASRQAMALWGFP